MGKIAIYIVAPELFLQTLECAGQKNLSMIEAEELIGGPRHTQVGAQLATKWRLPKQLQAVVQYHHQKETTLRTGLSIELNAVVDIVFLANLLIHAMQFGNSGYSQIAGVPKVLLERLRLPEEQLSGLAVEIQDKLKNSDSFLKIIGG